MRDPLERSRFRRLFLASAGFLIAGWFTVPELQYLLEGKLAPATITNISRNLQVSEQWNRKSHQDIVYEYRDEQGTTRSGKAELPIDWKIPETPLQVQYVPGTPLSRLPGDVNWIPIVLCGISFVLMLVLSVLMTRTRRRKRREATLAAGPAVAR